MTKTLNQIIFFFLHQNQNIFFSNIGNQNIFLETGMVCSYCKEQKKMKIHLLQDVQATNIHTICQALMFWKFFIFCNTVLNYSF
jgi:hypothetical protein